MKDVDSTRAPWCFRAFVVCHGVLHALSNSSAWVFACFFALRPSLSCGSSDPVPSGVTGPRLMVVFSVDLTLLGTIEELVLSNVLFTHG